jgi:hypothetical protein
MQYRAISWIAQIILVLSIIIMSGCKKNNTNNIAFLGTWISDDLADTIEFTSDHDLYKMIYGFYDHFIYNYTSDSITIDYRGRAMPYIYMGPPTPAYYQLNGNMLTIDFKRPPYAFRQMETKFLRK